MITVHVNQQEINKSIQQLQSRVGDMSRPMMSIATKMDAAVVRNFKEHGRPTKWQSLAASTLAKYRLQSAQTHENKLAKRRKDTTPKRITRSSPLFAKYQGQGYDLLLRSKHLFGSIQHGGDSASAWVGTNVKYAAIHNFGGKAGRGKKVTIPARPFMVLTGQDQADVLHIIGQHLANFRAG